MSRNMASTKCPKCEHKFTEKDLENTTIITWKEYFDTVLPTSPHRRTKGYAESVVRKGDGSVEIYYDMGKKSEDILDDGHCAKVTCPDCDAEYVAWLCKVAGIEHSVIYDLSFWHNFNELNF